MKQCRSASRRLCVSSPLFFVTRLLSPSQIRASESSPRRGGSSLRLQGKRLGRPEPGQQGRQPPDQSAEESLSSAKPRRAGLHVSFPFKIKNQTPASCEKTGRQATCEKLSLWSRDGSPAGSCFQSCRSAPLDPPPLQHPSPHGGTDPGAVLQRSEPTLPALGSKHR